MILTTGKIAEITGGVCKGSPNVSIHSVAELESAGENALACAFDKEHAAKVPVSQAGAFLVTEDIPGITKPQIIVKNGRLAMAQVLNVLNPQLTSDQDALHPSAVVDPSVRKGKNVTIGPLAVIEANVVLGDNVYIGAQSFIGENTVIGERSVIYPNVTIYANTQIGKRVRINSGSTIGLDGYGFVPHQGRHVKVPQVGRVVIEDDVELCGMDSVARATIGETRIGEGTKIDSMVHIAHNVTIGKHCIIVAQAGMAGNVTLGDNVTLAGKVGVSDHVSIGDNSVVMAAAIVTSDSPPNSMLLGFPAQDHRAEKKKQVLLLRLSDMFERLKALEKKILGGK